MTMRTRLLTLIRHAEAGSEHGSRISDFDRPLTEIGRGHASRLGAHLAAIDFAPDALWTSDAERALSTANILASSLSLPDSALCVRGDLYLAHTSALCDSIRQVEADIHHLAVVGHNPGLAELWDWVCDKDGFGLPTCGIARMEVEIERWSQLDTGCAKLIEFDRPEADPHSQRP
jgi:phosphohistidine phosphatase